MINIHLIMQQLLYYEVWRIAFTHSHDLANILSHNCLFVKFRLFVKFSFKLNCRERFPFFLRNPLNAVVTSSILLYYTIDARRYTVICIKCNSKVSRYDEFYLISPNESVCLCRLQSSAICSERIAKRALCITNNSFWEGQISFLGWTSWKLSRLVYTFALTEKIYY